MKKLIFVIVILMVSTIMAEAQFFAGGSFGFGTTGGSNDDGTTKTDKTKSTSFELTPKAGYILSDDLWVGMQVGFGTDRVKTFGATEVINKDNYIGFMPFVRYYALRYNKIALGLQGQFGVGFYSEKSESDGTTTDGPTGTSLTFAVFPGLSYNLSDKVILEAQINGLTVGYSLYSEKEEIAGTEYIDNTSNFGFGVDLDNLVTSGYITIGATIKF